MSTRTRINGILNRCGLLLQQHYFNTDYEPNEEMNAYRVARKQFYNTLEITEAVDLDYRLNILTAEQLSDRTNKSKLKKFTRMHVIEEDPELSEAALIITTKIMRRYEVQAFVIHIDLDTLYEDTDLLEVV